MMPLEVLKKGDFNNMEQAWQPDGTVIITLFKRKGKKHYRFRVRDLYGPKEEEVDVNTGAPKH